MCVSASVRDEDNSLFVKVQLAKCQKFIRSVSPCFYLCVCEMLLNLLLYKIAVSQECFLYIFIIFNNKWLFFWKLQPSYISYKLPMVPSN